MIVSATALQRSTFILVQLEAAETGKTEVVRPNN
jgi:hypothetical protein